MNKEILENLKDQMDISGSTVMVLKHYAQSWKKDFFFSMLDLSICDEMQLADFFAQNFKVDRLYHISSLPVDLSGLKKLPYNLALKYECIPLGVLGEEKEVLEIAFSNPSVTEHITKIKNVVGCNIKISVGERSDVIQSINNFYPVEFQLSELTKNQGEDIAR